MSNKMQKRKGWLLSEVFCPAAIPYTLALSANSRTQNNWEGLTMVKSYKMNKSQKASWLLPRAQSVFERQITTHVSILLRVGNLGGSKVLQATQPRSTQGPCWQKWTVRLMFPGWFTWRRFREKMGSLTTKLFFCFFQVFWFLLAQVI